MCEQQDERLQQLQLQFRERLIEFSANYYAPLLAENIVTKQEVDDELERFYLKKRSSLQTVYSYFSEQWDAYYQLTQADNGCFRSLLMRLEKAFANKYDVLELDIRYYTERFNQLAFGDEDWLRLRSYFERKWYDLLAQKESVYQKQHIENLLDEYARLLRKAGTETLNSGKSGTQFASRLAWLQARQSPDLRKKMNDLLPILTKSPLVDEISRILGRRKALNKWNKFVAKTGKNQVFVHQNNHSDIIGVCTGNDLNRLMPLEYCFLSDSSMEYIFLRKYSEKALQLFDGSDKSLEYLDATECKGKEVVKPDGMGPFIICIDTSGSMSGDYELMAKSIVLAIALLAEKQQRACRVILFSDQCEHIEFDSLAVGLPLLKDFLCRSFQGGTDLLPAMQNVLSGLACETYAKADLLLLSDFELEKPDSVIEFQFTSLRNMGASVYAVVFGKTYTSEYMAYFDHYWKYAPEVVS